MHQLRTTVRPRRWLQVVLSAVVPWTLASCAGDPASGEAEWPLGVPDAVVRLPEPVTIPPHGRDLFRNLVIPSGIEETRYVLTADFRPGPAGTVHHAVLQIDPTHDSRERDAADPDVGFGGMDMGASEPPDGHFIGWTPGKVAMPGAPERAWRLEGGSDFVVQVHLPPSDTAVRLSPVIGLYFSDSPPTDLLARVLLANETIDLPAGAADVLVTDAIELPVPVEVLAAYPHAHYLGRRMAITATAPDSTVTPILTIEEWNFGKQVEYRFDDPVSLPAGTRITMRYHYDNSSANPMNPNDPPRRVRFGLQSTDEMATLMLQVRLKTPEDLHRLREAQARHTLQYAPRNWAARYDLATSLLSQGRAEESISWFRLTVEDRPQDAAAWNNLGVALAQNGQLGDAVVAWQGALRADARNADAHANIGRALMAIGEPAEAAGHFRNAVDLRPDNARFLTLLGQAYLAAGNPSEAREALRQASELAPGDPAIQRLLQELGPAATP